MVSPRHIMLIEDDLSIQGAVSLLLEREGFTVTCACNGKEALRALDTGYAPALILLDMVMPIMDGREFRMAQQLIPRLARIPVVIISATSSGELRAGLPPPSAVMAKPFDIDQLLAVIERHRLQ